MTVSTTHSENRFVGDGVTTVFNFTFQCLKQSSTIVIVKDGQILDPANYTYTFNVNQEVSPGGFATIPVAPANGNEVLVQRATTKTQDDAWALEAKLSTSTLENAFDRACMVQQEVTRDILKKTFRWTGTWSASRNYVIGDAVYLSGSSYVATAANVNSAPPSVNWSLFANSGAGLLWRGAWSALTAYSAGDGVSRNGSSYVAISANTNSAPPSANWDVLAAASTNGEFIATTAKSGSWSNNAGNPANEYPVDATSATTCTMVAATGSRTKSRFYITTGSGILNIDFAANGSVLKNLQAGANVTLVQMQGAYKGVLEVIDIGVNTYAVI